MKTILVIRKKRVTFKVFEDMSIKKTFKDFSDSGGISWKDQNGHPSQVQVDQVDVSKKQISFGMRQ